MRIIIFLACLFSPPVFSEPVVIVHPSNTSSLSPQEIKNIYLGKIKTFSDGQIAMPLMLEVNSKEIGDFLKDIVKKKPNQWNSYWAKKTFTQGLIPPKNLTNDEIITLVSTNPNTIGVIKQGTENNRVKVVFPKKDENNE